MDNKTLKKRRLVYATTTDVKPMISAATSACLPTDVWVYLFTFLKPLFVLSTFPIVSKTLRAAISAFRPRRLDITSNHVSRWFEGTTGSRVAALVPLWIPPDHRLACFCAHFPHQITGFVYQYASMPALLHMGMAPIFARLEVLDLTQSVALHNESLSFLGSLQNLRALRLAHFLAADQGDNASMNFSSWISKLPLLRELDVSYSDRVYDFDLRELKVATGLVSLNLSACCNITDLGLAELVPCLVNLKTLDIRICMGLTVAGIQTLHRAHPALRIQAVLSVLRE